MTNSASNSPALPTNFSVEAWFGLASASPSAAASGALTSAPVALPDARKAAAPLQGPVAEPPDRAAVPPSAEALPSLVAQPSPGAPAAPPPSPASPPASAPAPTDALPLPLTATPPAAPAAAVPASAAVAEATDPRVVVVGFPDDAPPTDLAPVATANPGRGTRILVQWESGATEADRAAALARMGGSRKELIHTLPMRARGEGVLEVVELAASTNRESVLAAYRQQPGVRYAEVDQFLQPQVVSDDPAYVDGSLWGMYGADSPTAVGPTATTNPFGSNAEAAWNLGFTGSSAVCVGLMDEGFDITHPDLAANAWLNPYDPLDGIDNDGNGYIDDLRGWDFYHNDNSVYDGPADDHGTHVAGTIGAVGGNGIGVVGMNWSVSMIAAKFLGEGGGFTSGAVKALDYLTDMKQRHGINIVASNNSWSGGYSEALHEAIIRAAKQNILFVAAAGNASADNDAAAYYPANYNTTIGTSQVQPASYDAVVAVASITSTGALSSFSSYGSTTVDLGAPGSSILSTLPGGTYGSYSGTSMATPHVTGAIALYAASHPGSTAEQIRTALLATTTPTPSLAGKTVSGGRLNVEAFLNPGVAQAVYLSVSPIKVLEDGAANLVYTFTRTGSLSTPLTVNYIVAGTASLGTDYTGIALTPATKTIILAAGSATATLTVDPTADWDLEPDETLALTLQSGTGYAVGTAGAVVGTIQNDDLQVIEAFGTTKLLKDVAGKLSIQVGNGTPVALKSGGVQVAQDSFSGWQILGAETVAGVNQAMWKNTATNTLSLWSLDSNWNWTASTGNWSLTSAEAMQQEINFQQDFNGDGNIGAGVTVTLSVSPDKVLEDGAANLVYTFTRTGSLSTSLTANYTVAGTATLGTDYTGIAATPATKSITFAAGSATATLTVDPTADGELEPDETVALTLQSGTGYAVGTAGAVVGTIQNDESGGGFQVIEAAGATKLIKDGQNKLFTQVGNSTPIAVKYGGTQIVQGGFSGWETLGAETVAGVNQAMWKNTATNTLSLWSLDSNWNWTASTGNWSLTSAEAMQQEINFQQDFNGDGNIGAGVTVTLSISPDKVLEDGAANLVYTFTRTGSLSTSLTANYTVAGTATLGTDYTGIAATPATKSITFAAGSATATLTVDPTADGELEPDETVALTLQSGTGYGIGTAGAVVGTIQNDESGGGFQVIEAAGTTKLIKDGQNKLFTQVGNNTPISVKLSGSQIVQGGFSGWETLGAEMVAGVNQVMWKNTTENYLSIWQLDSNWNWTASSGSWGLNSAGALQQEINFQQDFNGNGIIGVGNPLNFTGPML